MAGIEMQNAVLIALVLLIVVFVVNQYNPSFFSFMQRCEGFVTSKGATATTGTATGTPATPASPASPASAATAKNTPMTPEEKAKAEAKAEADKAALAMTPTTGKKPAEAFADLGSYEGPASFGSAEAPAGCYPRDQLTPAELLPKDMNSIWAEQNPMGPGSLKGKNFLSAGALIGVNTVGQSLRNANLQIRSEPPNPQVPVSIFLQSTIGPDISHRSLEIN
jgi:hypothetical protein